MAEYIGRTEDEDSARSRKWREQFLVYKKCSVCGGTRLRDEALHFRIGGLNIAEVSAMSIARFSEWIADIEKYFSPKERKIAQEIVKEIRERLRFLVEVGLGYLSLAAVPRVRCRAARASASAWRPRSARSWCTCFIFSTSLPSVCTSATTSG